MREERAGHRRSCTGCPACRHGDTALGDALGHLLQPCGTKVLCRKAPAVSRVSPSILSTRATTALNGTAFQAKGGEAFSRRGSIQKNPHACTARMWTWRWRTEVAATSTNGHQVSSICHSIGAVAIGSQASAGWHTPQPCTTDYTSQRGQAPRATRCAAWPCSRAPTMAVTLPGERRSVEGERTGHTYGASAVRTEPCCVRTTAHVSCPLALGRGQTPSGVSPRPSPPWGSTWAVSCGHATARLSVQCSPGAGVTGDVQLSIRRRGS
jgi:hypothetical protein